MSTDDAARLARGEELEYRAARVGMVFVLMFCLGFTVIGLCLLGGEGLLRMLGVALIVFFGAVGIPVAVWRLARPGVHVRVSAAEGVWIRELGAWIPWSHIVSVGRGRVAARPVVELHLRDGRTVEIPQTIRASPLDVHPVLAAEHARRS
ncbi:hypothetical protein [Janibacter terrae]|uniref:hypothetical protein n=1 Tax=Janibacter terrae TaxID=103817 RepID=UPI000AAF47E2|nr:hypothetical protein [Janibacter terrae]